MKAATHCRETGQWGLVKCVLAAGRGRKAAAAWRSPVRGLSASTVDFNLSPPTIRVDGANGYAQEKRGEHGRVRHPPARQHVSTDIAKPVA